MEDGTYYPPTFKRSFQICALRSDGTYFSINVIFEPDVDRDLLKKIGTQFKNSLETLETFRTCECLLGKTCEKHGGSADV
jgi:hypothetical protein